MFRLIAFLNIWVSITSFVFAQSSTSIPWSKLQTGDLIMMSLQCRLCQLIELEEGLPFSHMALVVKNQQKISLVESWGLSGVKIKDIQEFWLDKKLNLKNPIVILRHSSNMHQKVSKYETHQLEKYLQYFLGKKYDPEFLWDNKDEEHQSKYYCSEFVYKLYHVWLKEKFTLKTKKMIYQKYLHQWIKYFQQLHMKVPEGKQGISPADFIKSTEFHAIFNGDVLKDLRHERVHGQFHQLKHRELN